MSSTNYLQGAGQFSVFNSSSTGAGGWCGIHPNIRNVTLQTVQTGSSVGALVSSVMQVQLSNDGVNPIATLAGTITLSSAASPGADGFSIDAHWNFIRGNLQSAAGGPVNLIASAHDLK